MRDTTVLGAHYAGFFFGNNRPCSPEKNFRPQEVSHPFSTWLINKWLNEERSELRLQIEADYEDQTLYVC